MICKAMIDKHVIRYYTACKLKGLQQRNSEQVMLSRAAHFAYFPEICLRKKFVGVY